MIKSTIYCSKCGKGNVIESPSEGHRFRCVNCNELNQVQVRKPAEDGAKRLKEVYQKNTTSGNLPGRVGNLRHKKTLVDKNIDLLEKVETMEKEALELKNEYLEMTHQLSLKESSENTSIDKKQWQEIKTDIEKVTEMGGKLSGLEDIKEILLNIQTEPAKTVDFSEMKTFFQKELKAELEKHAKNSDNQSEFGEIRDLLVKSQGEPAKELDFSEIKELFQKEMKSVQHVVNTIAGEVRVLRKELEDVSRKLMSGQFSSASNVSQQNNVLPRDSNIAPEKTTQFLAVPENGDIPVGEQKPSSLVKKGNKSFKAASEKLKSLKL